MGMIKTIKRGQFLITYEILGQRCSWDLMPQSDSQCDPESDGPDHFPDDDEDDFLPSGGDDSD